MVASHSTALRWHRETPQRNSSSRTHPERSRTSSVRSRKSADRWIDWISGVAFSAELFSGTHNSAVKLLEDYAECGIASPSLVRELLQEDVLNRFEVGFHVVLGLLQSTSCSSPFVLRFRRLKRRLPQEHHPRRPQDGWCL